MHQAAYIIHGNFKNALICPHYTLVIRGCLGAGIVQDFKIFQTQRAGELMHFPVIVYPLRDRSPLSEFHTPLLPRKMAYERA